MDSPYQDPQYEVTVRKHGDPIRVFAESAILRFIDELHGDAETRWREMNAVCYPHGGDGIALVTDGASVTVALIESIRAHWQAEKAKNPALKPIDYARDHACDFFYPNLTIPEP